MKAVLDTNVIVSGLMNHHNPPGELVRMVSMKTLQLCYDSRILAEYEDVLYRPDFPFPKKAVLEFIEGVPAHGELVIGRPLEKPLQDPDDEAVLEVALAASVPLITGNLKHFPPSFRHGVLVLSPAEFIKLQREK